MGSNEAGSSKRHYRHTLDIWDMVAKTMKCSDVPDFVPIVDQNLVVGSIQEGREFLVALGGYTVKNGTLEMVREVSIVAHKSLTTAQKSMR